MIKINFLTGFFLLLIFLSSAHSSEKLLKDFKNLYLIYNFEIDSSVWQMKDATNEQFRQRFAQRMEELGFNLVENENYADIILNCTFDGTAIAVIIGWQADGMRAEFILPDSGLIIKKYRLLEPLTKVTTLENMMMKLIRDDYIIGKTKVIVDDDGKIKKNPRKTYTILQGDIISETEEYEDDAYWENPIKKIGDLKLVGDIKSDKRMALLVYPANEYPSNLKLEEKGLVFQNFSYTRGNIADTYGYIVRFNLRTRPAKYECNYLATLDEASDMQWYSSEENDIDIDINENKVFWRDVSFLISSKISSYLIKKGYCVLDLTPARKEFLRKKPSVIIKEVFDTYDINELMILPHRVLTKKVRRRTSVSYYSGDFGSSLWHSIVTPMFYDNPAYVGFYLYYRALIYGKGDENVILDLPGDVSTFNFSQDDMRFSKVTFYSADSDDKGNVIRLKDGVIDDKWIAEKTLKKFLGYLGGLDKKVRIGGDLFNELEIRGY